MTVKFDRNQVKNLRASMLTEMEEVAKKYGIDVQFGTIRFSDYDFSVKMTARSQHVAPKAIIATPIPNTTAPNTKIEIGTRIYHPARKRPLIVTNVTATHVSVQASSGGKYRLKMAEALKYA